MQVDGRNFLVPVDAEVDAEADLEYEAVEAGRVLAKERQSMLSGVTLTSMRESGGLEQSLNVRPLTGSGGLQSVERRGPLNSYQKRYAALKGSPAERRATAL